MEIAKSLCVRPSKVLFAVASQDVAFDSGQQIGVEDNPGRHESNHTRIDALLLCP
jgi:hypothetical protein